jgi:uncharacterized protein (TIGR00725 family)
MSDITIPLISVIGAGQAPLPMLELARLAGGLLARAGYGVVTGGLGGVMEAACQGAHESGGLTLGILPGLDATAANPWCEVVIPTGLGQARNVLVVQAGLGALAISGGAGTLSEIGHALKLGKPVVGLQSWDIPGVAQAKTAEEAVELLLGLV